MSYPLQAIKDRAPNQRAFLNALVAAERVENGWNIHHACESTVPHARQGLVESVIEVVNSQEYNDWSESQDGEGAYT
jgi:hypothetical protein